MGFAFEVLLNPSPWSRPRVSKGGVFFTATKMRKAQDLLKAELVAHSMGRPPVQGPLAVTLIFYFHRPKSARTRRWPAVKPDIDNFVKMVLDCGNEILWEDDRLIVELWVKKLYCDEGIPRTRIMIEEKPQD